MSLYNYPVSQTVASSENITSVRDAIVVDVIVNEEHENYDGWNIGTIEFKFRNQPKRTDKFPIKYTAFCMESSIQEYPLIGETVLIYNIFNRYFYSRKININRRLQRNDYNDSIQSYVYIPNEKSEDRLKSSAGIVHRQPPLQPYDPTFVDRESVRSLKSFEGDVIFQGRYGASIRLGSSQIEDALNQKTTIVSTNSGDKTLLGPSKKNRDAPLIVIRAYQPTNPSVTKDIAAGLTIEDPNGDGSSIYLATDQVIDFTFATSGHSIHARSSRSFPVIRSSDKKTELDGNQILINSNRIVLNSKTDRIVLSSYGGNNFMSLLDTTIDTNKDFLSYVGRHYGLTVNKNHLTQVGEDYSLVVAKNLQATSQEGEINLLSAKNFIISSGENLAISTKKTMTLIGGQVIIGDHRGNTEPLVGGYELTKILSTFVATFLKNSATFGLSFTGPVAINPILFADLTRLLGYLQKPKYLSGVGYVQVK